MSLVEETRDIADAIRLWLADDTASPTILGSIASRLTALCLKRGIDSGWTPAVEYGAGDEFGVDGWTIREEPQHVPDVCCNRKLMKRHVYHGPWSEATDG